MITAERWNQISALFDQACRQAPEERRAFLKQACGDDDALYQEVVSLLEADHGVDSLLDGVALDAVDLVDELTQVGKQVGPYRLVRQLGAGGMGAVYLAERVDGQFEQQVALKLIKRGMDSNQILRRFQMERQILARLQHPNIARLLDGNVTEAGQPYFVMEYVDGRPIDAYCDTHQLTIDERLMLFQEVCRAVLYAHSQLVVHRDLKPSNILVTTEGTVKLLDFGIAKVLSEDETTVLTRTGGAVMTPEYASPEQVRGEPVSTSTDIYSLGVVLYELLAGHRPYELKRRNAAEVMQVICEQEPERPSTAVSRVAGEALTADTVSTARRTPVDRLRRRLMGDLDVICLTALRKEPARRYGSVEAFAGDLRRHLAGLPVMARRDTVGYRVAKFIQRHRMAVTAAAAVVLLMVTLVGFYTVQLTQERNLAQQERDRAQREATTASQVVDFLEDLFVASDPTERPGGQDLSARHLLERGVERVEAELADQPVVQARMMMVLGTSLRSLGAMEQAEHLFERAHALHLEHYGPDHMTVAQSLNELGSIHGDLGHYDQAETYFRQALETIRPLVDPDDVRLGVVANDLAMLLWQKGNYQSAEPLLREALGIFRSHYGNAHPFVAVAISNHGLILRSLGEIEAAEPLFREALALERQLHDEKTPALATKLGYLGSLLLDGKGDHEAAEPLYREALTIRRETLGEDHPYVAISLNELAGVLYARGDLEAADSLYQTALALRRRVLPDGHPHIAYSLVGLGRVRLAADQPETAEQLFEEALRIRRQALPEGHELLAETMSLVGASWMAQQRFDQAESILLDSYTTLQTRVGDQDRRTLETVRHLVDLYQAWGKTQQSASYRTLLPAE